MVTLDFAVSLSLLKMLLDNGANPNAVYTYIGTALHLACCSDLQNQYDICARLLDAGNDRLALSRPSKLIFSFVYPQ